MNTVAGVIQARMGSNRLPGKSMAKVYEQFSLLEMVILRVMKAKKLDMIILATSENNNCDPLVEVADRLGILTVRGSEVDVLSRFVNAIQIYKPDVVVRICADNPLIAPGEIDKLVDFSQKGQYDYAANNTPDCGLPDGLGCEILHSDTIINLTAKELDIGYLEHVTSYITSNPGQYSIGWLKAEPELWMPELQLDIDTKSDLEKMQKVCSSLPEKNAPYWTPHEIVMNAKATVSI
jgi:spore coat polysaccharide biosynthesis protein SpsF